jgi:hypothetical protein
MNFTDCSQVLAGWRRSPSGKNNFHINRMKSEICRLRLCRRRPGGSGYGVTFCQASADESRAGGPGLVTQPGAAVLADSDSTMGPSSRLGFNSVIESEARRRESVARRDESDSDAPARPDRRLVSKT